MVPSCALAGDATAREREREREGEREGERESVRMRMGGVSG
jgi:hypothetical protein